MGQLDGKTALVTGATAGIGLATAQRFVAEGAHVFITGRRQEPLDAAVAALGPAATGVRGDVADHDDLDRVFTAVAARGSGLDVLFTNAGGGEFAALADVTVAHFTDTFMGNVGGTLFTVQKALPLLNQGASIVLASSNIDIKASPSFSVYAATKAAIRSFARSWAVELMERDIRVNSIAPRTDRDAGPSRSGCRCRRRRPAVGGARGRSSDASARSSPRRSPMRCCSWPPTRAGTSPGPRSTSTAGRVRSEPAWTPASRSAARLTLRGQGEAATSRARARRRRPARAAGQGRQVAVVEIGEEQVPHERGVQWSDTGQGATPGAV